MAVLANPVSAGKKMPSLTPSYCFETAPTIGAAGSRYCRDVPRTTTFEDDFVLCSVPLAPALFKLCTGAETHYMVYFVMADCSPLIVHVSIGTTALSYASLTCLHDVSRNLAHL